MKIKTSNFESLRNFNFSPRTTKASLNRTTRNNSMKDFPSLTSMALPNSPSTTTNRHTSYYLENEALYEETMRLKTMISKLKKQLNELKEENNKRDTILARKDREISEMIENNKENDKEGKKPNVLKNISDQINMLQKQIEQIKNENEILSQNYKITKMNEYNIEKEIIIEEINKIESLIKNSKSIKDKNQIKKQDYIELQNNIIKQKIIYDELQIKYNQCLEDEENLKFAIKYKQEENEKYMNQVINMEKKIEALINKNDNLNKDYIVHPSKAYITQDEYNKKIAKIKKDINYYNTLSNASDITIKQLQEKKEKLLQRYNEIPYQFIHKNYIKKTNTIHVNTSQFVKNQDNKDNELKEKVNKSKLIEQQLLEEWNDYQSQIKSYIESQEQ